MPLRDYKCDVCDEIWEELRRDQSDPEKCKFCGEGTPERLISKSTRFVLKGNGWYQTDGKGKT